MSFAKYLLVVCCLVLPQLVRAGDLSARSGLETALSETELIAETEPARVVAIIINGLLSLLGMIFTILIIWGGFRWMTSGGNSQQVDEAKNIIKNAAIGLGVVMVSYAIVKTVGSLLLDRQTSSNVVGG